MNDWIPIEPPQIRLTPTQERIREMLRAGRTFREICCTLRIRSDYLRDEIFEIRKYEAIMGEKKRLTDEQKAAIIEMRQAGKPYKEISETVGCAKQTVCNVWNAYVRTPEKKTAINKEFDDAVNEMIAESRSADAEKKSAIAEPEQTVPAVPDAVIRAVEDKITELQNMIRDNEERIASMAQHNQKFAERVKILESWLKEVQL